MIGWPIPKSWCNRTDYQDIIHEIIQDEKMKKYIDYKSSENIKVNQKENKKLVDDISSYDSPVESFMITSLINSGRNKLPSLSKKSFYI